MDRWYLVIWFHPPDGKRAELELTVVMLLDGAIAKMTVTKGELIFPMRASGADEPAPAKPEELANEGAELGRAELNERVARDKEAIYKAPDAKLLYEVERSVLEAKSNSWDPRTQAFPAEIGSCVRKAREHLDRTREITGTLDFSGFTIQWVPVRGPSERRWYIAVHFISVMKDARIVPSEELTVVILPDGTIADMTLARGTLVYPFRR